MSWKDTIKAPGEESDAPKSSWKDTIKQDVSQGESGVRGAAQGLSFGFADEATGALEAALDWAKNDPNSLVENYKKHRDESRANYKAAEEANPATYMAGQVGGAIAPALLTGGGSLAATAGNLALQGAAQGLGSSEADLTEGDVLGAAKDTAIGGAIGGATGLAGKALSKIPVAEYAGKLAGKLGQGAENLAVKATGVTGAQANKFADDAGRQLLDRGLVRAGDTAERIGQRVNSAVAQSERGLDRALGALDQVGDNIPVKGIAQKLQAQVDELSRVPGNDKLINQLNKEIESLVARGDQELLPSAAEQAKRNFQGMVNYASPEADRKAAFHAADSFRVSVEEAAYNATKAMKDGEGGVKIGRELYDDLLENKKLYGLTKPIGEAIEKSQSTANQKSILGFGDLLAGAGGASIGGIPGALGAAAVKKVVLPRATSTLAVGADKLADIVAAAPQRFGRYAKVLQSAAQRGGNSLAATHFVLQQTDPEYREQSKAAMGDDNEQQE